MMPRWSSLEALAEKKSDPTSKLRIYWLTRLFCVWVLACAGRKTSPSISMRIVLVLVLVLALVKASALGHVLVLARSLALALALADTWTDMLALSACHLTSSSVRLGCLTSVILVGRIP